MMGFVGARMMHWEYDPRRDAKPIELPKRFAVDVKLDLKPDPFPIIWGLFSPVTRWSWGTFIRVPYADWRRTGKGCINRECATYDTWTCPGLSELDTQPETKDDKG